MGPPDVVARLSGAWPPGVHTVAVVASVDTETKPGAVFTAATTPTVTLTHDGPPLGFVPPSFVANKTVVVLVELYRRGGGWKVRAVGQGYDNGLAGLATDYGVTIDDAPDPAVPTAPRATAATESPSTISLRKVEQQAPALTGLALQAAQALTASGAAGRRAAVYLVLDHDWIMEEYYENFSVQAFADKVLALSANLDDDGTVPVVFSGDENPFMEEISLSNYRGRIGQLHTQVDWGIGDVAAAMRAVINHYQASGAAGPAYVIVQVGDEPFDKANVRTLLQNSESLGLFWQFVGFGNNGDLNFYKNLNASSRVTFRNAAFYNAGGTPSAIPNESFYENLLQGFAAWPQ
ncbi:VWA domain-containing protein [Streptomyces sp. N35]|uniref:VWA domain-containing protein n=1 Tax=Streptomyces sp. N35 TaxID=2795730 RepID=UPI0018F685EC|nr:VWA domain-containing protein [Streptomyces sp. N35]